MIVSLSLTLSFGLTCHFAFLSFLDLINMNSHSHSVIGRRPDGSYYYTHGAFLGHIVPGSFFLIWGIYWVLATFHAYLQTAAARRSFFPRAWYLCPWGTSWMRQLPLEPIIKIVLPCIGILGELWLGHPSWRTLIGPDKKFVVDNINDWQHSTMYACFAASGLTDLLGHLSQLPSGLDRAFLGLAFLCEGLLLAFHLKGPKIEVMVHLILVLQVFATVVATGFEGFVQNSLPAAAARPVLTILQVGADFHLSMLAKETTMHLDCCSFPNVYMDYYLVLLLFQFLWWRQL